MNAQKVVKFIFNTNIEDVKEIFAGKVPEYLQEHLQDKALGYRESRDDNTLAWIDFIGNLSPNNDKILSEHIAENYRG